MLILEFVIAFGLLVFLHELGHFLVTRLFGIEVEEFGFGYPPRLAKLFTWKGTEITLNWIPFGGFVRPKGENDPDIPDGLGAANPWKRIGVALAGPMMNLLLGVIIFTVVFMKLGMPQTSVVKIIEVAQNSPAETAGIMPEDIILSVNGTTIDSMTALSDVVKANLGEEIKIDYQRDGQQFETSAVPRVNPPEGEGSLGIVMGNPVVSMNITQAVPYAFQAVYEQGRQLVLLPGRLIQGQIQPEEARFVGPVGIYSMYEQAREADVEASSTPQAEQTPAINTLALMGIITVALGLTNLLPILPLDGGRVLFALPEIILKKRVPVQFENFLNAVSFFILIFLMIYITTQDIINPIVIP